MRVIIKGGVWKNTEDEILKAAVMKYGKNQWARISSLLVRKSAKQCKARWFEWLDPSIKKTEWTKDEDEKLLHLAKLMPTQWRTIAPIVGRTPAQCLERYQRLLDEAEQADAAAGTSAGLGLAGPQGAEGSAPTADSVRRLRPGEIDPHPETKPARPDPIDMDYEEKEMLSEARARLANTQGKKAKRKARERQIEEARRLATLQKRRELKAAGIELKSRKKSKGIDYNAEIPFEKQPLAGFHDTAKELKRKTDVDLLKKRLQQIEQRKRQDRDEERSTGKQPKRPKPNAGPVGFVPGSENDRLRKFQEAEEIRQRKPLQLPAPQVTQAELEDIVKLGLAGESTKALVESAGDSASETLMSDYQTLQARMDVRTPVTPAAQNPLMAEARNLRRMTQAQTPLLGQEDQSSTEFPGTGYAGVQPHTTTVSATPNPLLTPRLPLGATPLSQTPVRDGLAINPSVADTTPVSEWYDATDLRRRVAQGLQALPAPKNEFEIILPDEDSLSGKGPHGSLDLMDEDAGDRDARLQHQRQVEHEKVLQRRSQVVQRELPRPSSLPSWEALVASPNLGKPDSVESTEATVQSMVAQELGRLMLHDAYEHPVPGGPPLEQSMSYPLDSLRDTELATARQLVKEEMGDHHTILKAQTPIIRTLVAKELAPAFSMDDPLDQVFPTLTYDPVRSRPVSFRQLDEEAQRNALQAQFHQYKQLMVRHAKRAAQLETKLQNTVTTSQDKVMALHQTAVELLETLDQRRTDLACFESLSQKEEHVALPERIEMNTQLLTRAQRTEADLQAKYKALVEQRQAKIERIQELMTNAQG
ncbi:Pre-mRNA-splicing factor cef1 [Dispira parvispora]|uniref:Pre-mRNA-splicing factor cef1 n=1 Tax=Dispira parvispora TaxID=1520584 RepID=A0A9W8B0P5_9FUNG|nr:Pre-mRNA-splicing factor cef1 [Dispira parvispora]